MKPPLLRLIIAAACGSLVIYVGNLILDPAPFSWLTGIVAAGLAWALVTKHRWKCVALASMAGSLIGVVEHGMRHHDGASPLPAEGMTMHLLGDLGSALIGVAATLVCATAICMAIPDGSAAKSTS